MGITILGIATIILTIYAFFKNEKLLLYILVFLSTFTAAEVFHVEAISMPVLTFEFVGAVWLLREFINFIKSKPTFSKEKIISKLKENKLAMALIIFTIAMLLGEIYLLISGVSVEYAKFNGDEGLLKFGFGNVKQMMIVGFLLVLMIVLSFKVKTKEEIKKLLKVFAISTIFAIVWGFIQFIMYYLNIPYPAFLFNNNDYAAQCYGQISNNIKRISSIALEPSMFAINLMCFIPFSLGAFLQAKGSFKEKKNILTFVIIILATACAILTTSSTAYIGLIVVYGLYGLYILFGFIRSGEMSDRKRNFIKMFVATVVSIAFAGMLCFVSIKVGYKTGAVNYTVVEETHKDPSKQEEEPSEKPIEYNSAFGNIVETLRQMTINKLSSNSGQERMGNEEIGMALFKYSPIVGIGLGTYRTFSLFTNILVNMGIIGIIAFLYILYVVLKELIKMRKKDEVISVMFIVSIIATTLSFFISVPDFVFIYYWMILIFGYKYAKADE